MHADPLFRLVPDGVDLGAALVPDHPRQHRDVTQIARRDLEIMPIGDQQHSAESELGTWLGGHSVDHDAVSGGDPILLPSADDDGRQRTIWLGHGPRFYPSRAQTPRSARL